MLAIFFPNYTFEDYSRLYLVAISYLFYFFGLIAFVTGFKYVVNEGVNIMDYLKRSEPVKQIKKPVDFYDPGLTRN